MEALDPVPVILEAGRIAERLRFGRIPTASWRADDLAAQSASLIPAPAVETRRVALFKFEDS